MEGQNLVGAELALVGKNVQFLAPQYGLRFLSHPRQQIPVMALIGDVGGDGQMGVSSGNTLKIIANMPAVLRAGRHGARIGIGQTNLAVGWSGYGSDTIGEQIQKHRRGVSGTLSPGGGVAIEAERRQFEVSAENIDKTNQFALLYPVIQPVREKCGLIPAGTLDETRHAKPPNPTKG